MTQDTRRDLKRPVRKNSRRLATGRVGTLLEQSGYDQMFQGTDRVFEDVEPMVQSP